MQVRRLTLALSASLFATLPAVALAQPDQGATDLDQVVVTANRIETLVADSIVPVQVIDREEIERSQSTNVLELLRGRAGIDFGNQGGPGKLSSLFLRGAESDHVLVLVDGVKYSSATAGMAAFQDLPLALIDRVEIVRGPRSSLYGSEAIGGVIQVFTRRGGDGFSPHVTVGGGSHGSRDASAGFGYNGTRGWVGANAAYASTDGINACRGSGTLFQGCFTDEPDDDGYRNVSLSLRGGLRLTDALSVEGNFLNVAGDNEYDGSWTNRSKILQQVAGTQLKYKASDRLSLTAALGRSKDQSDDYLDTTLRSRFETRRDSASLQADIAVAAAHTVSVGVDHIEDHVDSSTRYAVDSRDNTAVFVSYQGGTGLQRWQASVRNDDNEQFGNHLTGGLGWGLAFANGIRFNASIGTGFKAPTFNDLYYPGSESPDLEPEESTSLNLGLSQFADTWNWSFNVYESRIDNLIVFSYPPPNYVGIGRNIDEARIRGAEFTYAITLAGWDLSTQLSHTDPRDRSDGANHDNLLARRARNTGRVDIDRTFGAFRIGSTVNGAGSRYDNAANTARLGGYGTMDLRLEYALNRDWSLLARASNVFDRDYETVAWYNQPGREYRLSLRYQPAR
ncbi:TonB-dependent vitamin B12 receptor [Luteimonas sp. RIT-PG2_3]